MKFEDLYKKIRAIDEGAAVVTDPIEAEGIEIIGGPMGGMLGGLGGMSHSEPPKQQDNVSMNVSLNGAGAGGVRGAARGGQAGVGAVGLSGCRQVAGAGLASGWCGVGHRCRDRAAQT